MIIPMTKYSFVLLNSDKENFLQQLQELGVVDITRSAKPVDEVSRQIMLEIEDVRKTISEIESGSNEHTKALSAKLSELKKQYKDIKVWGDYDIDRLAAFDAHFFCAQKKQYKPSWEQEYPLQVVEDNGKSVWFVVLGNTAGINTKELDKPTQTASEIEREIKLLAAELEKAEKDLKERAAEIPALEQRIQEMYSELNLYLASVSGDTAGEDTILTLEGFAPCKEDTRLKEAFDAMSVYYIAEKATAEDNPPIKLKNNAFVRQFETFTNMYGLPKYNEFDPTVFLSIFFLLFFAMCLADAGYGILLIITGLFFKSKKKTEGLMGMWSLITTLGVGSVFVGLILGGFFGIDLSKAAWVPAWMKSFMVSGEVNVAGMTFEWKMILAIAIGVVHLCLAMITKTVWAIKRDGFKHSLSAIGWTLLIVGGIIVAAIGLGGFVSAMVFKWLIIVVGVLSALGIYIFNRWGKNPLANIGSGLWDTYNMASGLMGDVLSYMRLYALGLSGGMLGDTFNMLAGMVKGSDPTWQWIPFVLILLVGHALNLAMSCLGAFVHPLRLNFVEFFKNSDYAGSGKSYNPIKK